MYCNEIEAKKQDYKLGELNAGEVFVLKKPGGENPRGPYLKTNGGSDTAVQIVNGTIKSLDPTTLVYRCESELKYWPVWKLDSKQEEPET